MKKDFNIAGKKPPQEVRIRPDMEQFISGDEPQTMMTVQIPIRLKKALKQEALDQDITIKNLLIQILESHFTARGA